MFIIKCSRKLKVQEILNYLSTKNNTGSNNNRHVKKVRKKVQHREENLSAVNAQKKASDENDQKRYQLNIRILRAILRPDLILPWHRPCIFPNTVSLNRNLLSGYR